MFFRILKLDLKKQKLMNILLLLFIILATVFSASGLNNIATVLNGTDYYFEKADFGDYAVFEGPTGNVSEILDNEELSAIKLYTRALKENLYETEIKRQEAIDGIAKNTVEIEHYVNEIVKISREDFMELPVNNSSYYLKEVISDIKEYYTDKLETIKTEFVIDEYNDCMVKGDKDRTIEVFQNVIENAIKYGDGGKISISFNDEEDCKLVSVTNTGCLLKEDDLPHIFDSFYRGSNTKKQEGSGLGLYICKQLITKMDGDIFAKLTENNTFIVTVVMRKE